ncbi:helix-turn-helix domain-containing protein [Azohydromonas lata]|uniref:Helix-turn-helix domain-containing protein n=1 Tax=Azohydromonas lata TaxID=45677 RepID=A0ABU5I7L5_9BURK|nr:helix-turn-helix domain-containing protein [Azohydromonas lata]MDZ5455069.1 helix-turn-helix domain-containing protein [Azohydromonas lata]
MERSTRPENLSSFKTDALVALLDRHGIPERQRVNTLEKATGISYGAARRRMTGETGLEVAEVVKLAAFFKEPLFPLLGALVDDAGHPATVCIGGMQIPCCIWPGPSSSESPRLGLFVAYRGESDHWIVVPSTEAGDRATNEVRRIVYEASSLPHIAIVSRDAAFCSAAVQALRARGLDPTVHQGAQDLHHAMQTTNFDGFVLDEAALPTELRAVLDEVRSRGVATPIIVLTTPSEADSEQERALAAVVSNYHVQLYDKPPRMLHLCSALELGLRTAARGQS